jgi:hypothetical protein
MFEVIYDNINMMIRVAEQIFGRKSELQTVAIQAHIDIIETRRRTAHVLLSFPSMMSNLRTFLPLRSTPPS